MATSKSLLEQIKEKVAGNEAMLKSLADAAKPFDKNDPLYKAFLKLPTDAKFVVFRGAFNASRLGVRMLELMKLGRLTPEDVEALYNGTGAVRTMDFHCPGASEEYNLHLEKFARVIASQYKIAEIYLDYADSWFRLGEEEQGQEAREIAQNHIDKFDMWVEDFETLTALDKQDVQAILSDPNRAIDGPVTIEELTAYREENSNDGGAV